MARKHAAIYAQVYAPHDREWPDESPEMQAGIEKYRAYRLIRVPAEGTHEYREWFGLNDPEDLPIHPEPTPTNTLPEGFPDDELLRPHIEAAPWKKSRGYRRPDGAFVEPHEYLVKEKHPDLFRLLRERIVHGGDGYWGTYLGYTNWYVHLYGYKYWATFVGVLNRVKLSEDGYGDHEPEAGAPGADGPSGHDADHDVQLTFFA